MSNDIDQELSTYQQGHSLQEQAWLVLQRWRMTGNREYLEAADRAVLKEMIVLMDDAEQQQMLMRFGPRVYTDQQLQCIREATRSRQKLPVAPIPVED